MKKGEVDEEVAKTLYRRCLVERFGCRGLQQTNNEGSEAAIERHSMEKNERGLKGGSEEAIKVGNG